MDALFGDGLGEGMTAYVGLVDVRGVRELEPALSQTIPSFMRRHESHTIPFGDHATTTALWVGTGNVDSGMHFDENRGGFMLLVSGHKDTLKGPTRESSIFVAKELRDVARARREYPPMWGVETYVAVMEAGDVLYIPHL